MFASPQQVKQRKQKSFHPRSVFTSEEHVPGISSLSYVPNQLQKHHCHSILSQATYKQHDHQIRRRQIRTLIPPSSRRQFHLSRIFLLTAPPGIKDKREQLKEQKRASNLGSRAIRCALYDRRQKLTVKGTFSPVITIA